MVEHKTNLKMKKFIIIDGESYMQRCVITKPFAIAMAIFVVLVVMSATGGVAFALRKAEQARYENAMKELDSLRVQNAELADALSAFEDLERDYNINSLIGEFTIVHSADVPTRDTLVSFTKSIGLWYPDITLAQFRQETGMGTNPQSIYGKSNNLMNMKRVSKRPTTQCGEYNGYGTYHNWRLAVIDMYLWERFVFSGVKPTREQYIEKLKTFAEDEDYINRITRFSKEYIDE